MSGIVTYGAYVPRLRLPLRMISEGQPGAKKGSGKPGERSVCNWDEDVITMGVEAARDCLRSGVQGIDSVWLSSTTAPFADRQNSGVIMGALNLGESLGSQDIGGSQRAGTTALINALNMSGDARKLVVASEKRHVRAGSPHELRFGDGAAAFTTGNHDVIAEFLGSASRTVDFVDHFRASGEQDDYFWEERWIRDEGAMKIVPQTIEAAMAKAGLSADSIDHAILPSPVPKLRERIAKAAGLKEAAIAPALEGEVGDTGCAHPLLMLAATLEKASPGETILIVSFGQGCDALLLKTTDALSDYLPAIGVTGTIAARREISDYAKYLSFAGLIERELGMRAEGDNKTALTQAYRRRDLLHGLVGGECGACGTRQLPRTRYCINPNCRELDTQEPFCFADIPARIVTWSADHLSFNPDPPSHYGLIEFEDGGRMFANFAEVVPGQIDVGTRMQMAFRVKDFDRKRNFRRYFWKAVPEMAPPTETKDQPHG